MIRTKLLFVVGSIVAAIGIPTLLYLTKDHWFPDAAEAFHNEPGVFWPAATLAAMILFASVAAVWALYTRLVPAHDPPPEEKKPGTRASSKQLKELYYANLRHDCQRYNLEDLHEERAEDRLSLKLDDIYQDQFVRLPEQQESAGKRDEGQAPKNPPIPLLQALNELETGYLVVRGQVGSGKSSFINHLTTAIIRSHGNNPDQGLPDKLARRPVIRILLRQMGTEVGPDTKPHGLLLKAVAHRIEALIQAEAKALDKEIDAGALQDFIGDFTESLQTNGIILLDGLDEVGMANNKRDTILRAIRDFLDSDETSAAVHLIVTSRLHAYENHLAEFVRLDIEPMNPEQVGRFVRHWYQQVSRERRRDKSDDSYQKQAMHLVKEIKDRASLQKLSETPMMLTLLLAIDFANLRLPESRAELYDRATNLLLQRWHRNLLKDSSDALEPKERETLEILRRQSQSTQNLRSALCHLAHETYGQAAGRNLKTDEPILFPESQVLGHLTKRFGQSVDAEAVRYFLQYRSNLLVAAGDDTLQFTHRSFHEFLAAEAFQYRRQSPDALHALMADPKARDWWREVLLFRMNMMKPGELADFIARPVMAELKPIDGEQLENRAEIIALCAQAAAEANLEQYASHDSDEAMRPLFHALQNKLQRLMQHDRLPMPHRAKCGALLGRVGDYRPGVGVIRDQNQLPLLAQTGERRHPLPDIEWVKIPGGQFRMGSTGDDQDAYEDEKPAHKVDVKPFHISRFPITNAQYGCFIEAGGYETADYWLDPASAYRWWQGKPGEITNLSLLDDNPKVKKQVEEWLTRETTRRQPWFWEESRWNNPNHPVVGVSWYEALAFCKWLSKCLQKEEVPAAQRMRGRPRLPSEDEWEYAARGDRGLKYAWGKKPEPSKGSYHDTGLNGTSAVGLFPAGMAFGGAADLYDMSGNVWEWTASRWGTSIKRPDFTYIDWAADEMTRNDLEPIELRVLRGGSWGDTPDFVRCAVRDGDHPSSRDYDVGFRVVFSLAADS